MRRIGRGSLDDEESPGPRQIDDRRIDREGVLRTALRRDDDRANLETLFQRELASLHGYVLARCGSVHIAEEVTGDVFVEAAKRFGEGRGAEVTAAWLRTVAKRRLIDRWRKLERHERRVQALGNELVAGRQTATVDDGRVMAALASMAERQRAALALRYLEDFSVSEVADALEIAYSTAESLLARARRSFVRAYEEGS